MIIKKKCKKKMGSPCLFPRQQALKMGYFNCLRVKNSNHLHTELSLDYMKNTKFYLESKASFIRISSIASFTLKPGFHMIVRIVPIVPVVSKKMFRRPGRSYGNATQTIANDPGDSKFTRSSRSSG